MNHQIDFILHHDLQNDIQNAFEAFLAFHRLQPDRPQNPISTIAVITPENVPMAEMSR